MIDKQVSFFFSFFLSPVFFFFFFFFLVFVVVSLPFQELNSLLQLRLYVGISAEKKQ